MKDFATKERRAWIESVSPFHIDEQRGLYMLAWLLSLAFGSLMPHERRAM